MDDSSTPVSSVHGILQAKILGQVAPSYSRRSSQSRDWIWVSCVSCIFRRIFFFFFFLPLHDLGSPQPQVGCLYWKCSVGSWKCGSCRLSGSKFLHRSSIVKEKNLFIFNWRIIALQYCVGFCHTSTWIIHRYTYVPSFLNIPRSSFSVPPLYVFTEHWFELPASHKFPLAILHMLLPYICYHTTLSSHPTFSFTTVSTSLFSMILIWWKFSVIHCYDCHR